MRLAVVARRASIAARISSTSFKYFLSLEGLKKPKQSGLGLKRTDREYPLCGRGGNLVQNLRCLINLRDAENHHRCVRSWFGPRIGVVDVDLRFAKSRCRAGQRPRPVRELRLHDVYFCVGHILVIEKSFGIGRIVPDESDCALALMGILLEGEDIDPAIS